MFYKEKYEALFHSKLLEDYLVKKGVDISYIKPPFYEVSLGTIGDWMVAFQEYSNELYNRADENKDKKRIYNLFWLLSNEDFGRITFSDVSFGPNVLYGVPLPYKKGSKKCYRELLSALKAFWEEEKANSITGGADFQPYFEYVYYYCVTYDKIRYPKKVGEGSGWKMLAAAKLLTKEQLFVINSKLLECNIKAGYIYFDVNRREIDVNSLL